MRSAGRLGRWVLQGFDSSRGLDPQVERTMQVRAEHEHAEQEQAAQAFYGRDLDDRDRGAHSFEARGMGGPDFRGCGPRRDLSGYDDDVQGLREDRDAHSPPGDTLPPLRSDAMAATAGPALLPSSRPSSRTPTPAPDAPC